MYLRQVTLAFLSWPPLLPQCLHYGRQDTGYWKAVGTQAYGDGLSVVMGGDGGQESRERGLDDWGSPCRSACLQMHAEKLEVGRVGVQMTNFV